MYADRYTGERRFHPGGLAAAVAINATVIGALMVAAPMVKKIVTVDPPITIYRVPVDPPPPPDPQPRAKVAPRASIDAPLPPLPIPQPTDWQVTTPPETVPPLDLGTAAGGTGTATTAIPEAAPVIVAPGIDPRYAADFQPAYPPSEQRTGTDGKVTVRVLIGTDGRVKQVERVSATSDAFYRATESQALRRWRFRPGTRDGVPQEAWRTMTVTFVMTD